MTLDYSKFDGLVPAVVQDETTGRVLMVGFMNDIAFQKTRESSGHKLVVKEISTDCDDDTLLIKVEALGPGVCHNGYQSCFYRKLDGDQWVETEKQTYDPKVTYGSN
jgi:phosphoribosyl-AMP cyclohydrolase